MLAPLLTTSMLVNTNSGPYRFGHRPVHRADQRLPLVARHGIAVGDDEAVAHPLRLDRHGHVSAGVVDVGRRRYEVGLARRQPEPNPAPATAPTVTTTSSVSVAPPDCILLAPLELS
ncbi:hypothetical protein [Haladaptatus halobius]|uniref:hypothetical protein n=1 Tax=Haladaptatus halobius TaxID=2884875 RepID=UPI001D0AFBD6|nr:hypothetical protein [Haladaptatus halobius]